MSRPLVIANRLGLKPFVVFDGDCDKATDKADDQQRRDNGCLLSLLGSDENPLPEQNLFGASFVMWRTRILDEVRQQVGEAEWDQREQEARDKYKLQSGVKRKNPVLVSATTELILGAGMQIPLLEQAVRSLLEFSNPEHSANGA